MYESELPANMPDRDYDEWYKKSFLHYGIRMGPQYGPPKTELDRLEAEWFNALMALRAIEGRIERLKLNKQSAKTQV